MFYQQSSVSPPPWSGDVEGQHQGPPTPAELSVPLQPWKITFCFPLYRKDQSVTQIESRGDDLTSILSENAGYGTEGWVVLLESNTSLHTFNLAS